MVDAQVDAGGPIMSNSGYLIGINFGLQRTSAKLPFSLYTNPAWPHAISVGVQEIHETFQYVKMEYINMLICSAAESIVRYM